MTISVITSNTSFNQKILPVRADTINGILDNGVYFIKNVGSQKLIDIPNGNYNVNVEPIQYTPLYFGNQRFILPREFVNESGENTYRIRPLYSQERVFAIKNNNSNDGNTLYLRNEEYSDTKLYSDKFVFEKTGDYYYIKTGGGTYNKYLGIEGFSNDSNKKIIQNSLPSNTTQKNYYKWALIKTDSLNVFSEENINITGSSYYDFNLKVQYPVEYEVAISGGTNTSIMAYQYYSEGLVPLFGSNVNNFIRYSFNNTADYKIRIFNHSTFSRSVSVMLKPTEQLFHYGVWDHNDMDQITSPNNNNHYLYDQPNGKRIFPHHFGNLTKNRILNNLVPNFSAINSTYSIFTAHGAPGLMATLNGSQDSSYLNWYDLPNLSGTKLVAWFTCDGATNITGNYTTNLAREVVINESNFGLGFRGSIFTQIAVQFSGNLTEAIGKGYEGIDAVYKAYSWTKGDQWAVWPFDSAIKKPYLYHKTSTNDIVYYIVDNANPQSNSDDGGYGLNNYSSPSARLFNKPSDATIEQKFSHDITINDVTYSVFKYGDIYTNILADSIDAEKLRQLDIVATSNNRGFNLYDSSPLREYIFETEKGLQTFMVKAIEAKNYFEYWNTSEGIQISSTEFTRIANSFSVEGGNK